MEDISGADVKEAREGAKIMMKMKMKVNDGAVRYTEYEFES